MFIGRGSARLLLGFCVRVSGPRMPFQCKLLPMSPSAATDVVRTTRSIRSREVEAAYRRGEFPMGHPGSRGITWHHPQRRAIVPLDAFHVSRSLERLLKQHRFEITFDRAFARVMDACADRRDGTWITGEIKS